jgi:putative methionine-R-sulfoxide reductase with GAF domain
MDQQLMTSNGTPDFKSEERRLDALFWKQGILFACVPVLTTIVVVILLRLLRSFVPDLFPWEGTDLLLTSGLYVLVVMFGWYMTRQQKMMMKLRDNLHEARFRAKETEQQYRSRLMAISALSSAVGDENDPRVVFDKLAQLCMDIFGSDKVSLMLLDDKTQELVVRVALGFPEERNIIGSGRNVGEGIAGWVALHREPLLLGRDVDLSMFEGRVPASPGLHSAMVIPLVVRDHVAGVLSVSNDESGIDYDLDDLTTLQVFAETAEYCIRHAENSDWMRDLISKLQEIRAEAISDKKNEKPDWMTVLPFAPEYADDAKTREVKLPI